MLLFLVVCLCDAQRYGGGQGVGAGQPDNSRRNDANGGQKNGRRGEGNGRNIDRRGGQNGVKMALVEAKEEVEDLNQQ